jgi:hypothetical protein
MAHNKVGGLELIFPEPLLKIEKKFQNKEVMAKYVIIPYLDIMQDL